MFLFCISCFWKFIVLSFERNTENTEHEYEISVQPGSGLVQGCFGIGRKRDVDNVFSHVTDFLSVLFSVESCLEQINIC